MEEKIKTTEKEVKNFKEDVEKFNAISDIIFSFFDDIYKKYLSGRSVREELREFRYIKSSLYTLINTILTRKKKFENILKKAEIKKENKELLLKFQNRYEDLSTPIVLIQLEDEEGFVNLPTDQSFKIFYDDSKKLPTIHSVFRSGGDKVLEFKLPPSAVLDYVIALSKSIEDCFTQMKDKTWSEQEIEEIKEEINKTKEIFSRILKLIKNIE